MGNQRMREGTATDARLFLLVLVLMLLLAAFDCRCYCTYSIPFNVHTLIRKITFRASLDSQMIASTGKLIDVKCVNKHTNAYGFIKLYNNVIHTVQLMYGDVSVRDWILFIVMAENFV